MGIYKVQSNGSAPPGLRVGDQVVTGGGTYLITGFNKDGSYDSRVLDPRQTTYNFQGEYDNMPQAVTKDNVEEVFSQKLAHAMQPKNNYRPLVTAGTTFSGSQPQGETAEGGEQIRTMSFQEAVDLAQQVMKPQYQKAFRDSARAATQRLERAGLYDTLYGQALAADAQRDVASELNSAIYQLALRLSQASSDQALDLLKLAVSENQYGAEQKLDRDDMALDYLYQMIRDIAEQKYREQATAKA